MAGPTAVVGIVGGGIVGDAIGGGGIVGGAVGAVSGGYHLPSDASHQPGPCEYSLIPPPTLRAITPSIGEATHHDGAAATGVLRSVFGRLVRTRCDPGGRAHIPTVNRQAG